MSQEAERKTEFVDIDGDRYPTTPGEPIGDESLVDGRRVWSPHDSKLAAALVKGVDVPLEGSKVLYLGAGAGTTPSYVTDVARVVYAVEFAREPARELLEVAEERRNLVPVYEDARKPEEYAGYVEKVDVVDEDVATRGQASVALRNARFLDEDGELHLCVKARSEDVTASPDEIYDDVASELDGEFDVDGVTELQPFYDDHAVVTAKKG
ncbi:MAG: fibrillarin-like rRNA/tRNA 2'-O-methyltransferase [Halobacteria archaeon]|nr:fibrillarin-like rRNA/tRNA 2'-O-methyltransferase [Halobacteria archaeon]